MDSYRNEIKIRLFCQIHCEQELRISSEKSQSNSAYERGFNIEVYPCSECKREDDKRKLVLEEISKYLPSN